MHLISMCMALQTKGFLQGKSFSEDSFKK